MSTNPKTKAYQERINKLAHQLWLRASHPMSIWDPDAPMGWRHQTPEQAVLHVLETFDPGSTREMQAEAMKRAVSEAESLIKHYERSADDVRKGIAVLEAVPWFRRLKLVDGSKTDVA